MESKFNIKRRAASFGYAFSGIVELFRKEPNAWIHLTISCMVIAAGFMFRINVAEWLFVVLAIGLVFSAEIFNSAIERLGNKCCPDHDDLIKAAKDLGAAGVLVAAMTAVIIGVVIFGPKLVALVK